MEENAIWKARAASAQSFTPWRQATTEIMWHGHSIIACSHHLHIGAILRTSRTSIHGEFHIHECNFTLHPPRGCNKRMIRN